MDRTSIALLGRYPKIWAGCTWLISLLVALFVLVLADFGGPPWIFILCGLWLCSCGLPTTLSLLGLAAVWGNLPLLTTPPLSAFAVGAASISIVVQTMSFLVVSRFLNRQSIR